MEELAREYLYRFIIIIIFLLVFCIIHYFIKQYILYNKIQKSLYYFNAVNLYYLEKNSFLQSMIDLFYWNFSNFPRVLTSSQAYFEASKNIVHHIVSVSFFGQHRYLLISATDWSIVMGRAGLSVSQLVRRIPMTSRHVFRHALTLMMLKIGF